MSSFDEFKQARRRELKAARVALGAEERASIDAAIAANLFELPEYEQADLVLPYLSFGAEIDTRGIIRDAWSRGKTVALPRCVEGTRLMRWFIVDSFDGLVKSSFGVDEPACDPEREIDPSSRSNALVIVPGLEFDRLGYRLGYGGGFYDAFLSGRRPLLEYGCRHFRVHARVQKSAADVCQSGDAHEEHQRPLCADQRFEIDVLIRAFSLVPCDDMQR